MEQEQSRYAIGHLPEGTLQEDEEFCDDLARFGRFRLLCILLRLGKPRPLGVDSLLLQVGMHHFRTGSI